MQRGGVDEEGEFVLYWHCLLELFLTVPMLLTEHFALTVWTLLTELDLMVLMLLTEVVLTVPTLF